MPSLSFYPPLFNLILSQFSSSLMDGCLETYEKIELIGNTKSLIKKMKLVHHFASTVGGNNIPDKLFTKDTVVIWHIIKMLSLIAGADKEKTNGMWFELIEKAEENPDINEGRYLNLCNKVKDMKKFYDFIIPVTNNNDFMIEIENDENGDWIRMSMI